LPINQATTKADPAAARLFLKKMFSSRPIKLGPDMKFVKKIALFLVFIIALIRLS